MILGLIIALVITKGNLDITNAKSHNENNQTFKQRFQKNVTDSREKRYRLGYGLGYGLG